jgi:hypothetical protein
MNLDFLFKNICQTCEYMHLKIEAFVKMCAKTYNFLILEHVSMYL